MTQVCPGNLAPRASPQLHPAHLYILYSSYILPHMTYAYSSMYALGWNFAAPASTPLVKGRGVSTSADVMTGDSLGKRKRSICAPPAWSLAHISVLDELCFLPLALIVERLARREDKAVVWLLIANAMCSGSEG